METEIFINIKDTSFENLFNNKDLVTIDEILDMLEDLTFDNAYLREKLDEKDEEYEEDNEDRWKMAKYEAGEYD